MSVLSLGEKSESPNVVEYTLEGNTYIHDIYLY